MSDFDAPPPGLDFNRPLPGLKFGAPEPSDAMSPAPGTGLKIQRLRAICAALRKDRDHWRRMAKGADRRAGALQKSLRAIANAPHHIPGDWPDLVEWMQNEARNAIREKQ